MNDDVRSEQACPVCGKHTVALVRPPDIDVMGVQPYSDMLGMGDLPSGGPLGIECLSCHTHWRDRAAFERNEPEPDVDPEDSDEFDFDVGDDGAGGDDLRV